VTIENELQGVPQSFYDFLDQRGLVYDPLTQIDMLACALSSQFLLFAGPSGTGKSTAAQVLADFLTPKNRHAIIDARPAWTATEDVVGQYSTFLQDYVNGPATNSLLSISGSHTGSPVVIVEEANLSPMEAYLGPVVTAASSVSFKHLHWTLHQQPDQSAGGPATPGVAELTPWPRVFGTVNVDSTAEAPAPKISGRACVVLLEPPDLDTALASTDAITPPPKPASSPPGAALLGDPRKAWSAHLLHDVDRFKTALKPLLQNLAHNAGRDLNLVSPRDVQRCVVYMSWHASLAEAAVKAGLLPGSTDEESAENSLLHFVLPGLSSEQFGRAVEPLRKAATADGLLDRRLTKLTGGESLFGVSPDFWASLS
jgi:energy-coupling factor transporter ATP-binding protein EcfA2